MHIEIIFCLKINLAIFNPKLANTLKYIQIWPSLAYIPDKFTIELQSLKNGGTFDKIGDDMECEGLGEILGYGTTAASCSFL